MGGIAIVRNGMRVRATGTLREFTDPSAAADAIRSGARAIAGALPFDPDEPAALREPETFTVEPTSTPSQELTRYQTVEKREVPLPNVHIGRVARIVDAIARGDLEKVVAARRLIIETATPLDPEDVLDQLLLRNPHANAFTASLGESTLVGASPEILVSKRGRRLTMRPLAGTSRRGTDRESDREQADHLLNSTKNLREHSYVIEWIREQLAPVCTLDIPDGPQLFSTPDVWHLGTPISAELTDPALNALDIAIRLHPTPAVCGTPTATALHYLRANEEPRGFYGGAVGWVDHNGDGDWIVAIRCAEIAGTTVTAFAGGGIVRDSDPQGELDETTAKLRGLLDLFTV